METDASEQTATLSGSHEIGGGSAGARSGYRPDQKTARDKFYVASSDSRDQAQMAPEPENPTVVVGGWIGASITQSATTATAGDATGPCTNNRNNYVKYVQNSQFATSRSHCVFHRE